ncbi:hypothetical protein TNCT_382121 [Trichonephila clavata]|uniref:Uncharacterized protein n=1 Tax=Trichonephila clavata TaxID=2740835 RepID=A0A8X6HPU9_TRICU|nr:hypothetical protein TNCT_382121 [Trichonephila clavata]
MRHSGPYTVAKIRSNIDKSFIGTHPEESDEKRDDLRKDPGLRHPEGSLRREASPPKDAMGDRDSRREGKSLKCSEAPPSTTEDSVEEVEEDLEITAREPCEKSITHINRRKTLCIHRNA